MMLATRSRRKRAAFARIAVLVTLAVLLFTPQMDIGGIQTLTDFLPPGAAAPSVEAQ
ncbi:hypothetical protein [Devosia sp. A369]